MFSLTLLDHLDLTYSQVAERHKAHNRAADSYRKWHRRLKGSEALLIAGAAMTAGAAAYGLGRIPAIAAAALAALALIVLLVHLTFDFETSAHAHAECSSHLWAISDRYRSLLSDLREGVLDVAEARRRRDKLMDDIRAVYERSSVRPLGDVQKFDAAIESSKTAA